MKPALLALAAFISFAASPLPAQEKTLQESTPAMKTALDQVVSHQLSAFAAGDFKTAFTFASAGIQKMFTPADFEKMVRAGYPIMLTKPDVDFGVALDDGEQGVILVKMTGPDGPEFFRYVLAHEATGWKINGVEQVEKAHPIRPANTA